MPKIIHDRESCYGCGACVSVCPDNWEMGDDGKANCKNTEVEEVGCNKQAAEICPAQCIKIVED